MKSINKFISFFLVVLCFSAAIHAFDGVTHTEADLQKHYIQGSDVKVANNGIFVNFEGTMLNVSSLFIDDAGVYIIGLGTCRRCGYPNDDMGKCQNPKCSNYRKG